MNAESTQTERIAEAVRKTGGVAAAASACGVSEQAVYNWLSGTRPYAKSMRRLSIAAGLPLDWLNGEAELAGAVISEPGVVYGAAFALPADLREPFERFAARYHMTHDDVFRLMFDSFTGRLRNLF